MWVLTPDVAAAPEIWGFTATAFLPSRWPGVCETATLPAALQLPLVTPAPISGGFSRLIFRRKSPLDLAQSRR